MSHLQTELVALELEISSLLSSNDHSLLKEIESKMMEICSLVDQIPLAEGEFAQKWTDKIGDLMAKYAKLESGRNADDGDDGGRIGTMTAAQRASSLELLHQCLGVEPAKSKSRDNYGSNSDNDYQQNLNPRDSYSETKQQPPNIIGTSDDQGELREHIIQVFDKFGQLRGETDIRGARALLPRIAKARQLIETSAGGAAYELQQLLFNLAHAKLHESMKARVNVAEQNLNDLIQFLCNFLREMAENVPPSTDELDLLFRCSYCKVAGHNNNSCPRVGAIFCFNCFRFKHSRNRCVYQPLNYQQLWDSL